MIAAPRRRTPLALCLAFLIAGPVAAQTYYKWTDSNGIVHFSDHLPPGASKVEERRLAAPPPPANPVDSTVGSVATGDAVNKAANPAATSGPARVVLIEHLSPHTGSSSVHVSGRVRNVGGEIAAGVAVSITAVDPGQGNPCLQAEASVSPSSLSPGETGSFETDVDSPCLFGASTVDLAPVWQD